MNVTGSLKNNIKVQEIGNNLFQGEQLAEQMQQRRTDDPVMPPTPDQMAPLYMDKTKYKFVGVQGLEDKGKIKYDKKGPYVVNKKQFQTGTSRDTLRLPPNVFKNPKSGLIDDVEYREIADKVNKQK